MAIYRHCNGRTDKSVGNRNDKLTLPQNNSKIHMQQMKLQLQRATCNVVYFGFWVLRFGLPVSVLHKVLFVNILQGTRRHLNRTAKVQLELCQRLATLLLLSGCRNHNNNKIRMKFIKSRENWNSRTHKGQKVRAVAAVRAVREKHV